jgi:hypothetical protein
MTPAPPPIVYRAAVLLIWGLAVYNSIACRGLFWDGAAFLVNIVDLDKFHDFYPARAHVSWLTQLPVLIAVRLGVTDMKILAIVQSAALFALPAALYQLAMARVRGDAVLLSIVLAAVAVVYLPTSFFIIGEYNAAYAAAIAAMAVLLTGDLQGEGGRRDAMILLLLGALCLRSYEAMVYLGPLLAAAVLWATWRPVDEDSEYAPDDIAHLLGTVAALAFVGAALVSGITMAIYWNHPHFVLVRAAVADFWQNLQFMIPFVGLVLFSLASLVWPRWLLGRGPVLMIGLATVLLVIAPWVREVRPQTFVFPPSHYVARTAAGCVLWAMLVVMWLYVALRERPIALLACLRRPEVGRRLALSTVALMAAAMVPDLALTGLWNGYLGFVRGVVVSHTGLVKSSDLPMSVWPQNLFSQDWTVPALSAVVRSRQPQALIVAPPNSADDRPFDPACGTLPRLYGYTWR